MGIYIFNILSLPVYKYIFKNKKQLCIVISIQMFLILAFRDSTLCVDYQNYSAGFEYIKDLSIRELCSSFRLVRTAKLVWPFSYESGYVVLNWLVGKAGLEFHALLVVCAAINMVSFGRFIYKYSDRPELSFAMFVALGMYIYCFGILRQSLAVSIVLWSLPAMLENKKIKSLLIIFVGFLFHRTALLFLPLIWFVDKQVSKKIVQYCIAMWGILFVAAVPIYNFVIAKILEIFGFYGYYAERIEYNNLILLMLVIAFVICFAISFSNFEDKTLNLACWGFLFSVFLEIFGMCNSTFARSVEYYFLFVIVLIPNLVARYQIRNTRIIINILVYGLMMVYMYISINGTELEPYKLFESVR